SAPDFSASAARSRSNAISCLASSRSPSIRSSVSSTTGPPPPDPEGFTPARRRKIHLALGVLQEAPLSNQAWGCKYCSAYQIDSYNDTPLIDGVNLIGQGTFYYVPGQLIPPGHQTMSLT